MFPGAPWQAGGRLSLLTRGLPATVPATVLGWGALGQTRAVYRGPVTPDSPVPVCCSDQAEGHGDGTAEPALPGGGGGPGRGGRAHGAGARWARGAGAGWAGANAAVRLPQIDYPEIAEGIMPRHRFMSAYEQRIEPPDRRWQYLLMAAEPYETIAFKVVTLMRTGQDSR